MSPVWRLLHYIGRVDQQYGWETKCNSLVNNTTHKSYITHFFFKVDQIDLKFFKKDAI